MKRHWINKNAGAGKRVAPTIIRMGTLALLTTAVGLIIAIPAMAAYLIIAGRIDSTVMEMDRLGQELVHLISAEALRDRVVATTNVTEPAMASRPRKPVVEKP